MERPYSQEDSALRAQLTTMAECDAKAEIQAVESPVAYIKEKITASQWV